MRAFEIRVACESQACAESGAPGLFHIDQKLSRIIEAHTGVERHYARCGFFIVGSETVAAAIGCMKRRMSLKNKVCLAGEPEAGVLEMGKHGFDTLAGGSVGGGGPGSGVGLCCGGDLWLLRRRAERPS